MDAMDAMQRDAFEKTREALAGAERVVVLTGAGISAESGVPTFRGDQGLWRNYSPQELATPAAFRRDPRLVWEWYDWRRGLVSGCRPNAGHAALVVLAQRVRSLTLITQNVDGLHRMAGSADPIELHGNIWFIRCTACGNLREDRTHPLPLLPECGLCGGLERPHIVWFGESLDPAHLEGAARAVSEADVLLVVGTSGVVYPAAQLAFDAKMRGAFVAVINVEETAHSPHMDVTLIGPSGELLPALL